MNAGHQTPIVAGTADGQKLTNGGPPIGMFEGIVYESGRVSLATSDLLVVYSDGLSEARSKDDVEFGDSRLSQLVKKSHDAPLVEIQQRIL